MPGAFHTELRPKSNREFELFLLDMKWGEPSVAQSSVEAASNVGGARQVNWVCAKRRDFFKCVIPDGRTLVKGDVVTVRASREGAPGIPVTYPYPFMVPASSNSGARHGH